MGDETQPEANAGAGAGANRDLWAPPDGRPSLEKREQQPQASTPQPPTPQPSPQDQHHPPTMVQPPQSPSVHNQATVTSMPSEGFAPPASASGAPGQGQPGTAPGTPGYGHPATPPGLPTYGTPNYAQPNPAGGYGTPHPQSAPGPGMPGGYGYPGYPQGYGWPGMPMAPQNNMGTAAMVLGILSCCLFCIYGIVSLVLGVTAIILGVKGKKRADRGEATNRGQAQAGFITGIIGTTLGVLTVAALIVGIVFAINHGDNTDNTSDSDPFYNSAPSVTPPPLPQV